MRGGEGTVKNIKGGNEWNSQFKNEHSFVPSTLKRSCSHALYLFLLVVVLLLIIIIVSINVEHFQLSVLHPVEVDLPV